jgi:hypothetical protein
LIDVKGCESKKPAFPPIPPPQATKVTAAAPISVMPINEKSGDAAGPHLPPSSGDGFDTVSLIRGHRLRRDAREIKSCGLRKAGFCPVNR